MLGFGNPWFLTGLLTAAVPIYLHLYFRKKPVLKNFPSLRLIRLSFQQVMHRLKLRNYLLLALRLLSLVLLCSALARPFLGFGGAAVGSSGTPMASMIVLDNSMSMGATHQGISLFSAAKAKAMEIVQSMGPYDKAGIALLNDPGQLLTSQLTWNKDELRALIKDIPLSMAGTNLHASFLPALKMLLPVRGHKRTLYVISDVTKTAWQPFLDSYDLNGIEKDIDLVLIPIGQRALPNLAVTDIGLEAPLVLKGRPVELWAVVANHSGSDRQTRVSLYIDDEKKQEIPISLAAGEQQRVKLTCAFPREGLVHVQVALPSDSLPHDDRRHLAVTVRAPQQVLLIKPAPDRSGRESRDDLFLRFALNPLDRRQGADFLVDSRTPDEVTHLNLHDYIAVFLINQRELSGPMLNDLSSYVFDGGSLIIFPGSQTDPMWANRHLLDAPGGRFLLPARFFKRVGNAVSKSVAYQLTDLDYGHPAWKLFRADGQGSPSRAHFFEFFQVQPNPAAWVLARMSHGLPAIVEEQRGEGRVLLFTFSANTDWHDWPLKPTFLPFIQQIMHSILVRDGSFPSNMRPGTPIAMTVQNAGLKRISLTIPGEQPRDLPFEQQGSGLLHFSTSLTDRPGFYTLTFHADRTTTKAFAINPPAEESDLERYDVTRIPRFISVAEQSGRGRSLGEQVTMVREGLEVGPHLLWVLLLIALVEVIIANLPPDRRITNPEWQQEGSR